MGKVYKPSDSEQFGYTIVIVIVYYKTVSDKVTAELVYIEEL
jgi:hypothetical protein